MLRLILLGYLILAGNALANGRYGYAALSNLGQVEAWVSENDERFWIKGEDKLFYYDPSSSPGHLPFGPGYWRPLKGSLYFYYGAHALPSSSKELLHGGRIRLIESSKKLPIDFRSDKHGGVRPFQKNHSLIDRKPKLFGLRDTVSLSGALEPDRWRRDMESLTAWNRYSYGTEIDLAQAWLIEQFSALKSVEVEEHSFDMPGGEGTNVVATIKGQSRPGDVYIVGAHYDSTSQRPSTAAPGAEDNASGVAGLLSLARIFADNPPEATIIFVAFSGEEQGLYGSKAWLKNVWLKTETQDQIKAVLIMDMIGYSGDAELDLLLETSSLTKPLLADIQSVNRDPDLVVSESFDYWGSDHEPFLDNDVPAILFIEDDYLRYPDYHRTTDTMANIHPTLGTKILTLIADSLALWVYRKPAIKDEEAVTVEPLETPQ